MKILYENNKFVVPIKDFGVFSEKEKDGKNPDIITLCEEKYGGKFYPVNRLDAVTGGLIVLARSERAAAELSAIISDKTKCKKRYFAVITGCPTESAGVFEDLLFFDRAKRKSFVCDRERAGVKKAELAYIVLGKSGEFTLVSVTLMTGRTHQIRAQFSSRGMPVVFDGKYGSRVKRTDTDCAGIALFSAELEFDFDGRHFDLREVPSDVYPFSLFEKELGAFRSGR